MNYTIETKITLDLSPWADDTSNNIKQMSHRRCCTVGAMLEKVEANGMNLCDVAVRGFPPKAEFVLSPMTEAGPLAQRIEKLLKLRFK